MPVEITISALYEDAETLAFPPTHDMFYRAVVHGPDNERLEISFEVGMLVQGPEWQGAYTAMVDRMLAAMAEAGVTTGLENAQAALIGPTYTVVGGSLWDGW